MDAGAIGFASSCQPAHAGAGGKPVPSRLATLKELSALAEPLAERSRGIFATARRSDFDAQEIAELSVRGGRSPGRGPAGGPTDPRRGRPSARRSAAGAPASVRLKSR